MKPQLDIVGPEIHSGKPVVAGTRMPVKTLVDHPEAGDSLEVFLDDVPLGLPRAGSGDTRTSACRAYA
jgi:hypothetical protein